MLAEKLFNKGFEDSRHADRLCRDAWNNHHGLSKTEAKRQYISTLIDTMHKYATTTPEARELVSELEFVWDQIKSNSASSSGTSPGHIAQSQSQQIVNPSYSSIGQSGSMRRDDGQGGSGLKMLRPVSDGDEEENDNEEDEEYQEARGGTYDEQDEEAAIAGIPGPGGDFDVRNRKWRKRIERALMKMTTEVAALREQMEAYRLGEGKRKIGIWAWMTWLVWVAFKHMLIDLTLLGMLVVWARRKRDKRVETGMTLMVQYLGEHMRRLLRPLRLPTQKQ